MKRCTFFWFLIALLALFFSKNVFAQSVMLNVNAKKAAATTNEFKNWKEKAAYIGTDLEFSITVTAKAASGSFADLIVKMDVIESVEVSGDDKLEVTSYWLKYNTNSSMGPWYGIWMYADGEVIFGLDGAETIDKTKISTLALKKNIDSNGVTITLFDFPLSGFKWGAHVIISAFLVDDVTIVNPDEPEILSRDIQIIYFDPDWKKLLQSASNSAP